MTSRFHCLASERLTATCKFGSHHHTLLFLKVVTHFVYVPLVCYVQLLGFEVFEVNVFELGLVEAVEGENDIINFADPPAANALVKT